MDFWTDSPICASGADYLEAKIDASIPTKFVGQFKTLLPRQPVRMKFKFVQEPLDKSVINDYAILSGNDLTCLSLQSYVDLNQMFKEDILYRLIDATAAFCNLSRPKDLHKVAAFHDIFERYNLDIKNKFNLNLKVKDEEFYQSLNDLELALANTDSNSSSRMFSVTTTSKSVMLSLKTSTKIKALLELGITKNGINLASKVEMTSDLLDVMKKLTGGSTRQVLNMIKSYNAATISSVIETNSSAKASFVKVVPDDSRMVFKLAPDRLVHSEILEYAILLGDDLDDLKLEILVRNPDQSAISRLLELIGVLMTDDQDILQLEPFKSLLDKFDSVNEFFKTEDSILDHDKKVEKSKKSSPPSMQKVQCSVCDKMIVKYKMYQHKILHTYCDCGIDFANQGLKKRHIYEVHIKKDIFK